MNAGLQDANVAYSMKCLCLPDARGGAGTVVDHIRLFRNHPGIRWQFRVHEQILPGVRNTGGQVLFADVVIHHTGYCDHALRQKKLQRDVRLLHLQDAETPDDPFTLFNLGAVSQELGQHAEAIPLLRRSLALSAPSDSIVRKIYALVAGCHRVLNQPDEALAACLEGRRLYADDTELLFVEGQLRRERGELEQSEQCFLRLLTEAPPPHFASVDASLRGYKTRHNLAVIYQLQQRLVEAEAHWRVTLEERPDFLPSWLASGELYLAQGRWADLDAVLARLDALPDGGLEGTVLRARGHLARKEFAAARPLLELATAQEPRAVWPHVILSHVLLQEGRDPAAAEQTLRDILALAPDHAEAKHNLDVLLHSQNRASNDFVAGGLTLADLYQRACTTASDIHEHLPTLYELASQCRHLTEFGTRTGISTAAFLFAQPDTLVAYDRLKYPQVDRIQALAGRTRFHFVQADVLHVEIEPTDLLFIDTWHVYDQLKEELRRHAGKARKYIVLHDTTTFGERGETAGHRGLWPAVEEFLAQGTFRLRERRTNNNGLTILEKLPTNAATEMGKALLG